MMKSVDYEYPIEAEWTEWMMEDLLKECTERAWMGSVKPKVRWNEGVKELVEQRYLISQ